MPPPRPRRITGDTDDTDYSERQSQNLEYVAYDTFIDNHDHGIPTELHADQNLFAADLWFPTFVPDALNPGQTSMIDCSLAAYWGPSNRVLQGKDESAVPFNDLGECTTCDDVAISWPCGPSATPTYTNDGLNLASNQVGQDDRFTTLFVEAPNWNSLSPSYASQSLPAVAFPTLHDAGVSKEPGTTSFTRIDHTGALVAQSQASTSTPTTPFSASRGAHIDTPRLVTGDQESQIVQLVQDRFGKNKQSTSNARIQPPPFTILTIDPSSGALKGKITKPRRAFAANRRREVAQVRKMGACFRCRMWNIGVICPLFQPAQTLMSRVVRYTRSM